VPVLAAAEAVVELRSADWCAMVPFAAFYSGYRTSVRRADELVTAVESRPSRHAVVPQGRHAGGQAISKVVMAAVRADRPRIALGSIAPTVIRCAHRGGVGVGRFHRDAQAILQEEIRPSTHPLDGRRTSPVAANLLAEFWRR